jgi:hypothetical protein
MIKTVIFKPIALGALCGQMAYHLELDSGVWDINEGAEALYAIKHHKCGPNKTVVLFDEGVKYDDDGIMTLIKTLHDNGYFIVVETEGQIYRQWYAQANWLTLRLKDQYAGFVVNDVSMEYQKGAPEPDLPQSASSLLYIFVRSDDMENALDFVKGAKYPWKIERVTVVDPKEQIFPKEE